MTTERMTKAERKAHHRGALAALREGESHFIPASDGIVRFGWFECPKTREERVKAPVKGILHHWEAPAATGEGLDDIHSLVTYAAMYQAEQDEWLIEQVARRVLDRLSAEKHHSEADNEKPPAG
jgi:hypothetical protein